VKLAAIRRLRPVAVFCSAFLSLLVFASPAVGAEALTDAQVRKRMIDESIAAYHGACPCPDSKNRSGRKCGKNSAYSKPGGQAPLCYPEDIPDDQVDKYRNERKIQKPKADR